MNQTRDVFLELDAKLTMNSSCVFLYSIIYLIVIGVNASKYIINMLYDIWMIKMALTFNMNQMLSHVYLKFIFTFLRMHT